MKTFPSTRPVASTRWYKAHGLGNDYLVVQEGKGGGWTVNAANVSRVCDRTMGVGSDGVVVLLAGSQSPGGSRDADGPPRPSSGLATTGAAFKLRMFNPDGGEFERSGNGLRILASYLQRTGRVRTGESFVVEVGGDLVRMEVHSVGADGIYDVTAEMGKASVDPRDVALAPDALDANGALDVPGAGRVAVRTVSVGNPHCVVFTEDLTLNRLRHLGPALATHAAFAEGTNVQLARVIPRARAVDALVWERGVGHTLASGTSACAVAVASVHSGQLTPGQVEIRMEGGTLQVGVTAELGVTLRGPVQEVATGEMTTGFLEWLSKA